MLSRPCFSLLLIAWLGLLLPVGAGAKSAAKGSPVAGTIEAVQPKIVKIHGAGGFRGLEAYQSGIVISADGFLLTVSSTVLDTDHVNATLNDGRRFEARLLGVDPRLGIAVMKIEASDLPNFELSRAQDVEEGARVLAFSNMFNVATGNEPASVQHGVVSSKTRMDSRQGTYRTPYRGSVYVLDTVTSNPGTAGGALVTRGGRLVGLLGKELTNARNNTWLNHAIPIGELRASVEEIREGKFLASREDDQRKKPERSLDVSMLGMVLVPDVVDRTPPYVDQVRPGSPADREGIRPDDLIVLADDQLIQSCKSLAAELEYVDREDPIRLTVLRDGELLEVSLKAAPE